MKPLKQIPHFYPRLLMFVAEIALVAFVFRFITPTSFRETNPEPGLDPIGQVGLYIVMVTFGAGIGFWLTFGDLINQGETKS